MRTSLFDGWLWIGVSQAGDGEREPGGRLALWVNISTKYPSHKPSYDRTLRNRILWKRWNVLSGTRTWFAKKTNNRENPHDELIVCHFRTLLDPYVQLEFLRIGSMLISFACDRGSWGMAVGYWDKVSSAGVVRCTSPCQSLSTPLLSLFFLCRRHTMGEVWNGTLSNNPCRHMNELEHQTQRVGVCEGPCRFRTPKLILQYASRRKLLRVISCLYVSLCAATESTEAAYQFDGSTVVCAVSNPTKHQHEANNMQLLDALVALMCMLEDLCAGSRAREGLGVRWCAGSLRKFDWDIPCLPARTLGEKLSALKQCRCCGLCFNKHALCFHARGWQRWQLCWRYCSFYLRQLIWQVIRARFRFDHDLWSLISVLWDVIAVLWVCLL